MSMGRFRGLLPALLLLWCCAEPAREDIITIVGAKLIDGTNAEPVTDSVVVIEGESIRAAGPQQSTPVPKDGVIIDGRGKTIIPGLVDLHVHYYQSENELDRVLEAQLGFGVTTARSVGVDPPELVAKLRQAGPDAPRILTAGLGFTHPEGHPVGLDVLNRPESPEAARAMVRELAEQNVDLMKIWVDSKYGRIPEIAPDIRQAIIEQGREHGLNVTAHIFDEEDVRQFVELGVTDFLHTVRDTEPMSAEFIELMKAKGVTFAATLTVIESRWQFAESPELVEDPDVQAALPEAALKRFRDPAARAQMLKNPDLDMLREEIRRAQRFSKQMFEAGVTLTLGSDSGGAIPAGWGTHNEMRLLVEAGIPPLDVIRIATRNSASRLGEAGANIGILEPGKQADLILLEADPTSDIANARKIHRVMRAGRWVK